MKTSNKKNKKRKVSPELKIAWFILGFIAVLGLASLFSGCKAKQPIVSDSRLISTSIEKDKLTPIAVPGENANLRAQFECDSLNNVLLKNFNELKSKNMASNFSFVNGQLSYNAQTQPDTVYVPSTDHWYYVNRNINKTITITKTVAVDKPVRGFLWWTGLLFWLTLSAFAAIKFVTWSPIKSVFKKLLKIN